MGLRAGDLAECDSRLYERLDMLICSHPMDVLKMSGKFATRAESLIASTTMIGAFLRFVKLGPGSRRCCRFKQLWIVLDVYIDVSPCLVP